MTETINTARKLFRSNKTLAYYVTSYVIIAT